MLSSVTVGPIDPDLFGREDVHDAAVERLRQVLETILREEQPVIMPGAVAVLRDVIDLDPSSPTYGFLTFDFTTHVRYSQANAVGRELNADLALMESTLLERLPPGPNDVYASIKKVVHAPADVVLPVTTAPSTDNSKGSSSIIPIVAAVAGGLILIIIIVVVVVLRRKSARTTATTVPDRAVAAFENPLYASDRAETARAISNPVYGAQPDDGLYHDVQEGLYSDVYNSPVFAGDDTGYLDVHPEPDEMA